MNGHRILFNKDKNKYKIKTTPEMINRIKELVEDKNIL